LVEESSKDKTIEVRKVAACVAGKDATYRYALMKRNV
jgi:ribonuclease HI